MVFYALHILRALFLWAVSSLCLYITSSSADTHIEAVYNMIDFVTVYNSLLFVSVGPLMFGIILPSASIIITDLTATLGIWSLMFRHQSVYPKDPQSCQSHAGIYVGLQPFEELLDMVKQANWPVWVRELPFLNSSSFAIFQVSEYLPSRGMCCKLPEGCPANPPPVRGQQSTALLPDPVSCCWASFVQLFLVRPRSGVEFPHSSAWW